MKINKIKIIIIYMGIKFLNYFQNTMRYSLRKLRISRDFRTIGSIF